MMGADAPLLPSHRKASKSQLRTRAASFNLGNVIKSDFLIQRARITNLAVLILVALTILSLIYSMRRQVKVGIGKASSDSHDPVIVPLSIVSTLSEPRNYLEHLIIVPGHGVWIGSDVSRADQDEEWLLEPNQLASGRNVRTFLSHIATAVELALKDSSALLIYSGGQTRVDARSTMTEAGSYARLAGEGNLHSQFAESADEEGTGAGTVSQFDRFTTEEFALDSYENLLFSIARFKEFTGHYPAKITVVGFGMKRMRFETVHRSAIKWSAEFNYVGIDNDGDTSGDYEGERIGGFEPFKKDLYGCKGVLLAKRKKRNPYRRWHPYHSSAPELSALLEYCPDGNEVFGGILPW